MESIKVAFATVLEFITAHPKTVTLIAAFAAGVIAGKFVL